MNDEEQPALSEAEEARIRALLADAKYDEPMPDAVVARLDRVLAGLAEEPLEPANVVPLAERRRRATRMLVAAAAVVVAGIGIGQVVSHGGGALSSGGSAAGGAERSRPGAVTDRKEPSELSEGGSAASLPEPGADSPAGASALKVRPKHFAEDSRRVQSQSTTDSVNVHGYSSACARGHWGAGKYVPIEYGRTPAYLVLRRHTGDTQVADLFLCGSDDPVRSVTLPGP